MVAIVWDPTGSPRQIAAAAVVLAVLAIAAYLRILRERPVAGGLLLAMRLGAIAAIVALFSGPSREVPQEPAGVRPRLDILVDTSQSMQTADCDGRSRIRCLAGQVLTPVALDRLRRQFDIELQGFDETVHGLSAAMLSKSPDQAAIGRTTRLIRAVTSRLNSRESDAGAALLVLSDGRDSEDANIDAAALRAAASQIPIYCVGAGQASSPADAALLAIPSQEAVLPGEPAAIQVRLYHSGLSGQTATVHLAGDAESRSQAVTLGAKQPADLTFQFARTEPGQYELRCVLDPVGDEAESSNNSQTVFLDVLPQRIRVLLLEGAPGWDSKFLAQSLRKDEQVALTQVTQVGTNRQIATATRSDSPEARVPVTIEDWGRYDVVILGRQVERLLDPAAAKSLAAFISEGGGKLVMARGPAWDATTPQGDFINGPLAVLQPVVWGDAELHDVPLLLTSAGSTTSWLAPDKLPFVSENALSRLPGFETLRQAVSLKPGAVTLLRAVPVTLDSESPAIVTMPYGRGIVVQFLGDGLWRWGLLPAESQDLTGLYDACWSNLVRWLALGGDFAPGEQVSLQLSRTSARLGDELLIDLLYKHRPVNHEPPRLTLTDPDGELIDASLDPLPGQSPRYRATLIPDRTGVYQVEAATPGMTPARLTRRFNVYDLNLERLQSSANLDLLRALADRTGGRFYTPDSASRLLDDLHAHRQSLHRPPRRDPLWHNWPTLLLMLLWLGSEWLLRRTAGLW